jgi:hypothetical protein
MFRSAQHDKAVLEWFLNITPAFAEGQRAQTTSLETTAYEYKYSSWS